MPDGNEVLTKISQMHGTITQAKAMAPDLCVELLREDLVGNAMLVAASAIGCAILIALKVALNNWTKSASVAQMAGPFKNVVSVSAAIATGGLALFGLVLLTGVAVGVYCVVLTTMAPDARLYDLIQNKQTGSPFADMGSGAAANSPDGQPNIIPRPDRNHYSSDAWRR